MTWDYWICLYIQTHCGARGLRMLTMGAYKGALLQFQAYVEVRLEGLPPQQITARHVLEYLEHLRRERKNGDSSLNRTATILKNFYRAMVAMGHLQPAENPMAHFPRLKAPARKLPVVLSVEEVERLLSAPRTDCVLGLRDRAILSLLYGTGIRASECAGLREEDVDLDERLIRARGKGGHERVLPLAVFVVKALGDYRQMRRQVLPREAFFQSSRKKGLSRGTVYERVKTYARISRIPKRVSPHVLRHTFATHQVKAGTHVVTLRDLLGHRCLTSTQIYVHVTAQDLREAADRHPIKYLAVCIEGLLPKVMPYQPAPFRRRSG